MKNLKFVILVFILICGCEKEYYWEYVIQNETNTNVLIKGFDRFDWNGNRLSNYNKSIESIEIEPYESFSVRRALGFQPDTEGIFEDFEIDSVNIIFDNEKVIVQFCNEYSLRVCELERNIVAYETEYVRKKTGRSSNENEYRFTYTLTEEDYNNAVPMNE